MAHTPLFEWEGREYQFEQKTSDWYWSVGILSIAGCVTSILFGNVLLALVILVGGTTIILVALKHPRVHHFAIYDEGVGIDENLYLFERMIDFSVLEYADETLPPSLSIKTSSLLSPHIFIPIIGHDPVEIYNYISQHLPEGNHHQSPIDRLVDLFRL